MQSSKKEFVLMDLIDEIRGFDVWNIFRTENFTSNAHVNKEFVFIIIIIIIVDAHGKVLKLLNDFDFYTKFRLLHGLYTRRNADSGESARLPTVAVGSTARARCLVQAALGGVIVIQIKM